MIALHEIARESGNLTDSQKLAMVSVRQFGGHNYLFRLSQEHPDYLYWRIPTSENSDYTIHNQDRYIHIDGWQYEENRPLLDTFDPNWFEGYIEDIT